MSYSDQFLTDGRLRYFYWTTSSFVFMYETDITNRGLAYARPSPHWFKCQRTAPKSEPVGWFWLLERHSPNRSPEYVSDYLSSPVTTFGRLVGRLVNSALIEAVPRVFATEVCAMRTLIPEPKAGELKTCYGYDLAGFLPVRFHVTPPADRSAFISQQIMFDRNPRYGMDNL